ncbi:MULTISPECIES: glycosyltransferase family 2 protein [Actinomyces]|uniref:Glycosyltransferase family 2 protein n=1 Tax=Actinomyces respiraculi TaxID=2744574 RepID=A0A7T0LLH1_9ACTO|nr:MULTISPECIES: glycosyltransferase family 2 protein [Actinomyces]QPL05802.1 glycosyltransferase family 2 protein [Actinomyces respiraculi]
MTTETTGTIRVVTVTYNPGAELDRFLASVPAATARKVTLVIADNGSEHHLVDELAARHGARVVRSGANLGYGGGANLAAAELTEDWIVVANPDIIWRPGSLDLLVEAAQADPTAGCLGPRLLNSDGTVYPSGRALPTLLGGAGHALLTRVWPSNPFSTAYHAQNGNDAVRQVGWLSGACLLLPRHVWQALGGFDDDYFMFFEDVDLGSRVSRAGWRNIQVPEAVVIHEQGASWKARPEKMIRAHHASARRYMCGVYDAPWQAPVRWAITGGLRLREEAEVRLARRARRTH